MSNATELYIQNFAAQEAGCCPVTGWMHDNPEDVKTAQFATTFFGTIALLTLPVTFAYSVTLGVVLAVAGVLSLLASLASWVFLNYISCAHHDMRVHVFTEGVCEGGRLYYRGDVPILELTGDTPTKKGWAHGFLLGKEIDELYDNMELLLHTILRQPKAEELPHVLQNIRGNIPGFYLEELNGLSEGFNAWAKQSGASRRLSSDDFLLIHLIADSKYFDPYQREQELTAVQPALNLGIACTTILHRDQNHDLVFARNMDWCPFGKAGAKTLLIVWKKRDEPHRDFAALTIPGMIGVVSGWNEDKLCVAMNVCPGKLADPKGTPAILFNRMILECEGFLERLHRNIQKSEAQPLGPYHLTVANANGTAECISFFQGEEGRHVIRKMEEDKPLFTVNWCYPECDGGYFNSEERTDLLTRYFDGATQAIPEGELHKNDLIKKALTLRPYVNSFITTHCLVFEPQSDRVELRWDNGYAASQPYQALFLTEVFHYDFRRK